MILRQTIYDYVKVKYKKDVKNLFLKILKFLCLNMIIRKIIETNVTPKSLKKGPVTKKIGIK